MTQTDDNPITRRELDLALREQRQNIAQDIGQLAFRFDRFEGRFDRFERRFDDFERRFDDLERRVTTKVDLDQFRAEVGVSLDRVLASLAELRQARSRWWPFS